MYSLPPPTLSSWIPLWDLRGQNSITFLDGGKRNHNMQLFFFFSQGIFNFIFDLGLTTLPPPPSPLEMKRRKKKYENFFSHSDNNVFHSIISSEHFIILRFSNESILIKFSKSLWKCCFFVFGVWFDIVFGFKTTSKKNSKYNIP